MRRKSSSSVRIYYRRFNREELVRVLGEKARRLDEKLPLLKVTLFGSYAKDRATAASDVDILVIYRGWRREDAYDIAWDVLYVPQLELHVYTEEEYRELRERLGSLVNVAEREGITVYSGQEGK